MNKTYNIYCDESTHIENDGHPYMLLSYVSTPYHLLKMHNKNIREMKMKHFYRGEMKWSKISKSQYSFYNDVIEYFFNNNSLNFRAIVIDKSQLNHEAYNQDHNIFYDKMYYQLLNKKLESDSIYNIYLDIKDTHSYLKAKSLKQYLLLKLKNIRNLQIIRSHESELLQLTDVLMGAVNYKLRELNKVTAKNNIVEKIEEMCGRPLTQKTGQFENKFNLFFIDLNNGN
jgi:hypothetical protein